MIRRLSLLLSVILSMSHAMAVDTGNMVTPRFRSLQVTVDGNELAPPVITLNSDDKVTIAFDELAEDRSYLRYSLVHCDASWQPSGLVESEYLDGFNQADVEDYSFSR
ncbi:type IX secretion system plug protein domain-containing protein, partial [uncultured Muribaculum sp.]